MDLFEFAQKKAVDEAESGDEPATSSFSEPIFTVGEITTEIKSLLEGQFGQERIWVKGEISNYRGKNQSNHIYFSLKDESSLLGCAFFRNQNRNLTFELKEGLQVLCAGRISVYPPRGNYQLIIDEIRPGGVGELYLRFEQLKRKLEAEGLFDPARKKPLPEYPNRIGLVTSATGAVVRDVIHVIERRCPFVTILLYPVKVQGDGAAEEVSAAIVELNASRHQLDVLIVGRGGGSIEDLWAFNEESVARAIANSKIPVVSAVGHQTDFTIADFVADMRAATPSQAAELAVPDVMDLRKRIELRVRNVARELAHIRNTAREKFTGLLRSGPLRDPRQFIRMREQRIEFAKERMISKLESRVARESERRTRARDHLKHLLSRVGESARLSFRRAASNLDLLNPLSILSRGYSVVTNPAGGIVKKVSQVKTNDSVTVRLHEGSMTCQVKETFKN